MSLKDNPMPANTLRILSFPGFYESVLSRALDDAEEQEAYNLSEDHPELDIAKIHDAFYRHSTYQTGFLYIAEACVDYLNAEVLADTGIELTFESMQSPREYNFGTDTLFVTINDPKLLLARTRPSNLDAVIKEYFTSGPGFISFYSNDPNEWRAKPLDTWDHNELGALFEACLRQRCEELDLDEDSLIGWLGDAFTTAVDKQTDWVALRAELGITE